MPDPLLHPDLLRISRRGLLTGAGALCALGVLTACGATGPAPAAPGAAASGAFPLTVEHLYGKTTIPAEPVRVVTVGYSDQDPLLALGVRPVGVTDWYGDHPYATWPWAQDELGDAKPVVMNKGEFTGTPNYKFEEIAKLEPDLIVGYYTQMSPSEYEKLTAIAPTVGPPPGFPEWGAPWGEYTRHAGRTFGKLPRAEELIAGIDKQLADARAAHPEFAGKSVVVAERSEPGITFARSPNDQRSQLLTGLGFVVPDEIKQLSGDKDGAEVSDEQMGLLDRDVLLWNTGFSPEVRPEIERAPLYSGLNVVKAGRSVFIEDPLVSAAWTWGTVLSLPSVIDAIVAQVAAVVK
ncbi:iron-siderophore ABC transporter substrate-binding protein [Pseudonocardia sp. TRM90224]|uniref:iron-siderophore ABC transporter substrate-binding protein n=1 Tax=Pseudonocardia sp. TRM90224 TaxID=2812678 RepID=UPI001E56905C|nr:iron-siderophore ABC transporter substrate-binding protein [Pseudonocardia sp. TRM90224]